MKYINEICVDELKVSSHRQPVYRTDENLVLTVRDSFNGMNTKYRYEELDKQFLGYGVDVFGSGVLFVEILPHEAKLHEYVVDARTKMGEVERSLFGGKNIVNDGSGTAHIDFVRSCRDIDADFIEMQSGHVLAIDIEARKTIIVNTNLEAIELCGKSGSVASRSGNLGVDPSILTLYRLLGQMINETGVNLLTYRTIHFYSPMRGRLSTVVLWHTKEAELFFTKMYLDVVGR